MEKQDRKEFERIYGPQAQEVIDAFNQLEPFAEDSRGLMDELRELERRLNAARGRRYLTGRIKETLANYTERLEANQQRGMPVRIGRGDLSSVFKFEFSQLDSAEGFVDSFGTKRYTGQPDLGVKPYHTPRRT